MRSFLNRKLLLGICSVSLVLLTGCNKAPAEKPREWDLVAHPVPLPKPVVELQTTLPGAEALPETVQHILVLQRAFFAGDFAVVDAALMRSHRDYVDGKGHNEVATKLFANLEDTQLAGIDTCNAWLRAMPQSYAAHWLCGAMWKEGAHSARSRKFAHEVSAIRFQLMHERLQRAKTLLERATTLTPKPIEALTILGSAHYFDSEPDQAETYLQRAQTLMPKHEAIYDIRLNYALPQWGGSDERVKAVYEEARIAGMSQEFLLNAYDTYIAMPGKSATPGAPRAYWERVIKEHPTRLRLKRLLDDFITLDNWLEALPITDRLIKEYPEYRYAYYRRGQINENLGRMTEARRDYATAAARGEEYSLQNLILANIRGGLGITQKSFDTATIFCRYGAALGTSVGANCIGSLYFEGGSEGVPYRKDPAQGLAWHLVGARGGHYNSQHDLGWLLYTNRSNGMKESDAKKLGIFWLRRAAEQNHNFAKRKLEQADIALDEDAELLSAQRGSLLDRIVAFLDLWRRILF